MIIKHLNTTLVKVQYRPHLCAFPPLRDLNTTLVKVQREAAYDFSLA